MYEMRFGAFVGVLVCVFVCVQVYIRVDSCACAADLITNCSMRVSIALVIILMARMAYAFYAQKCCAEAWDHKVHWSELLGFLITGLIQCECVCSRRCVCLTVRAHEHAGTHPTTHPTTLPRSTRRRMGGSGPHPSTRTLPKINSVSRA